MKKEITAYITALINVSSTATNTLLVKNLNDLLNFAENLPAEEDRKSKGYIKLVEKICDNFVEKNCELVQVVQEQKLTIAAHELNNSVWKNAYNELKEENKKLKSDVFDKYGAENSITNSSPFVQQLIQVNKRLCHKNMILGMKLKNK